MAFALVQLDCRLGGDCSNGQECLLDSTCKNGMCECNEGLYTLKIGNTHNCVPGNPADAGSLISSFRIISILSNSNNDESAFLLSLPSYIALMPHKILVFK